VRDDVVPQMAGADELMSMLPHRDGVSYAGLVLNRRGLERALSAGVDEVNAVVVVSETFSRKNQGVSTSQAIDAWKSIARETADAGRRATLTISAAFGCPYEGTVPPIAVRDVVAAALEEEPYELVIADTIGAAVPTAVRDVLAVLEPVTAGQRLRCHFHNTRNMGYANVFAALAAGVSVFDASIGGTGGCPFAPKASGNIATEELVWALERSGAATGVDLERLIAAGTWLGEQLGKALPSLVARAGPFPTTASKGDVRGSAA
jgi:hydroxymethylglutaryl-CoA lyase